MKNMKRKRLFPAFLAAALICTSLPMTASADSANVVTLGANLSEEQKNSMYEYFGTSADEVETIEVTNSDEREYMEGIATESQIGTKTYSCSYVEPTEDGGIQVKVANLTFVTSSMIASTLLTAGMENCNVVAASPIEVSGTGALTGIMMAYESASGEELSEEQKEAATEELVTTGDLADDIGQEEATDLMNQVKQDVIEDGITDKDEIENTVTDTADKLGVTLTDEQIAKITSLMENISQYDYDVKALKETLDNLDGKEQGFFDKLVSTITGIFGGGNDGGIINDTNDSILGDGAVVDSTLNAAGDAADSAEEGGFFDKIANFFKGIFGGDSEETSDTTDESESSSAEENDSEETSGDVSGDASEDVSDDPGPMNAGNEDADAGTDDGTEDSSSSSEDNTENPSDDPGPMNAGN